MRRHSRQVSFSSYSAVGDCLFLLRLLTPNGGNSLDLDPASTSFLTEDSSGRGDVGPSPRDGFAGICEIVRFS